MLINREPFAEGYRAKLKEAGMGDTIWNNSLGLFGQYGSGTAFMNEHLGAGYSGLIVTGKQIGRAHV